LGGIGLKNSSFFHVAQSHRNLDFMELYVVRVHERYSQLCARSSHTCERLAWRETDCVVKQSQNIQQCHYYCTTRIDTGHQIKFFWDPIKKISAGGSLSLRVMYWMNRANSYSRYHKKSHIKHMIFESCWWRTTTMTHERLLFYWGFIMLLSNRERIVVWPFHMRSNMELSFLLIIVLLVYNVLSTRILVCGIQVGAHPQSTIIERLNNLDHKCLYPQIRCKIIW
jgi:hypothetical protein